MIYLTSGIICILNIWNLKRRKQSKMIPFLLFVLLWILMGANNNNPDYYSYEALYYGYNGAVSPDIGYSGLSKIFRSIGVSYDTFRLILTLIALLLINTTIKKIVDNRSGIYLLFFLYPFIIDIVQLRNFFMMSIVIFAIPYLVDGGYKQLIKYTIMVLIASTIHITAIVYLPLVLVTKFRKTVLVKLFFLFLIIIGVLIGINKTILIHIIEKSFEMVSINDNRFSVYNVIKTRFGFLLYWSFQILNYLIIRWSQNITLKSKEVDVYKKKFVGVVKWINIYTMLFMPLIVLEMTYFRFTRNIYILNYMVYLITYIALKEKKQTRILYSLGTIFYTLVLFFINIYLPYSDTILKSIFEFNWILK